MPATAQIQVDSANPSAAPQGTINLDIAITGNGFQKGAKAQWFVTGTTNPGGVTVNSTTFKGSTQLTANITVAPDAVISGFDILVTNANGRTGKGTDKFAVTLKGTPIGCTTSGTPGGFTLVTVLNPVQPNGAALITTLRLGNAVRVRPLDLNWDGVIDCEVLIVDPLKRLSYSWNSLGLDSVVLWTLTPAESGTHLRMEQSGFRPDQQAAYQGANYGWQNFIGSLERVVGGLK